MESNPRFEIQPDSGPVIKVIGDTGEVTEVSSEEVAEKVNPRYKYLGEYNVNDHPNYKPSPVYRDRKLLMEYDKQVAKYPKRFKARG